MQKLIIAAASAALAMTAAATTAQAADVTLSSPDDLTSIGLGQTVTINVSLSNLMGDEFSDLVVSTVAPGDLFNSAVPPTAGLIVPGSGLFIPSADDSDPGSIFNDAIFGAAAENITAAGVFYSFQLTADMAGSGIIGFGDVPPTGVLGDFTTDATLVAGDPLNVTVVVPEPATAGLLAAGTGLALLRRRRRA